MPWHDFLSLMLVNMSAALFVVAGWLICGVNNPNGRGWAPAFAAAGAIALVGGAVLTFTWPFTSKGIVFANFAFGEPSMLLGIALLAAAISIGKQWPVWPVAIYAFVAGLVGIVVGLRIINLGITASPMLSGVGMIGTGLVGLLSLPALACVAGCRVLRCITAVLAILMGVLWGFTGLMAYWMHVMLSAKLGM